MFSAWNHLTSRLWWSSSSSANVLPANITGDISLSGNTAYWDIKDFFNWPLYEEYYVSAPSFNLVGKQWVMYLFPSGYRFPDSIPEKFHPTEGWFGMVLVNTTDREVFSVQFGVGGKDANITCSARCFKDAFYSGTLLDCSEFELFKEDLAPGGVLRVFCQILNQDEATSAEVSTQAKQIDSISSPEDFKTDCTAFSHQTSNRNRPDGTSGSEISRSNDFASFNLFNLNTDGNLSLNEEDTEILAQILQFRRSGAIPNTTPESTNRLLYIAEKCGATDLIPLDVDSMMSSMTEDNVCDVIRLAKLKGEAGLLEQATRFYEESVHRETSDGFTLNNDCMPEDKNLQLETLEPHRFVKSEKVIPNDFSEMVYKKLVALTCHPNNRDAPR